MQIPYVLGKSSDKVGFGAVIKNIETDKKAMIIDFDAGAIVATMYCGGSKNLSETNYKIFIIYHKDLNDWIVLNEGQDDHGVNDCYG